MPENVKHLAAITAMESAAFRLGQVARGLLADHPDLLVASLDTSTSTSTGAETVVTVLALHAGEVADVLRWAETLGIAAHRNLGSAVIGGGYEHASADLERDGLAIRITGCTYLDAEEWAAAQDESSAAPAGGDAS